MQKIHTVTIVGANGTMGCNVSGIFASFGNAKVYMVSRTIEKSKQSALRAAKSVRADSIVKNLIPADYSMLADCVKESDLVFECVSENMETKLSVTKLISEYLREDAIAASGTSGLSLTTLAEIFPEQLKSRYFGIHMFNPPYNLTLCEATPTRYSDKALFDEIKAYLRDVLRRTVVEVKDSPAFLGNRIGFQFINRAMQYAECYQDSGGIDYIDAIFGSFTGRSMAPLVTADFVGLDVHKAIVDNIYQNAKDYANDTFTLPNFAQKLIDEGKLGRKTRGGLYKLEVYDNCLKRMTVYDITSGMYRDKMEYCFSYAEQMKKAIRVGNYQKALSTLVENHSAEAMICLEFLLQYIVYALSATEEVGYDTHSADDVMATGFNWCPPLAMAEALSTACDVKALITERLPQKVLGAVDLDMLLKKMQSSKYDYRLYFRSE